MEASDRRSCPAAESQTDSRIVQGPRSGGGLHGVALSDPQQLRIGGQLSRSWPELVDARKQLVLVGHVVVT